MLVLTDLDGPLADFEHGVYRAVLGAGRAAIAPSERRGFYAADDYRQVHGDTAAEFVTETITSPGFYRTLDPVHGAAELLDALEAAGHDVYLCTAPLHANPTCASDKLDWVAEHLGERWRRRTFICSDKTLVRGDVLIDDKPDVTGATTPTWTQLLYTTPQNHEHHGLHRVGPWDRDTIDALVDHLEQLTTAQHNERHAARTRRAPRPPRRPPAPHGATPGMHPSVTPLRPHLYMSPMPESTWPLQQWGIESVVSLSEHLPPHAARRFEWGTRGDAVGDGAIMFTHWPIHDGDLPDLRLLDHLVDHVALGVTRGIDTLVHCQEGQNRSGLVAALTIARLDQISGADALAQLRERRHNAVNNRAFAEFLNSVAAAPR